MKDTNIKFGDDCVFFYFTLMFEVADVSNRGLETVFYDEIKISSIFKFQLKKDHYMVDIMDLKMN